MMKLKMILSVVIVFALSITATPFAAAQEAEDNRQEEYVITVPEGTVLPIILTAYLNTKNSQAGDTVYATTTYPIWIQQRLVIPKGSEIRGTLTDVVRPGRIKGKGRLVIRFDDILLPNGVKRDLIATFKGIHGPGDEKLDRDSESVAGGTSKGEDVETIITRTGQGASVGAIVGVIGGRTGKGTAIGAGAGAAAGLASVLFSRGKDLVLEPGMQFDLEIMDPMEFSFYELEFTNYELNSAKDSVQSNTIRRPYNAPDSGSGGSWPTRGIGGISPF